jgi:hypothetical protein
MRSLEVIRAVATDQGDLKVHFSPPVRAKQEEGVGLLPLCVGEIMKCTVVSGLFQEYNA